MSEEEKVDPAPADVPAEPAPEAPAEGAGEPTPA